MISMYRARASMHATRSIDLKKKKPEQSRRRGMFVRNINHEYEKV